MASARVVALASAIVTACAAANAQAPGVDGQLQGKSALPSSTQEPEAQAAGPTATPPPLTPWPNGAPLGLLSGGGVGTPPSAERQECIRRYTALRSDVEMKGMAAKAGSEKRVERGELCKLVTDYAAAEIKWATYVETSMSRCGIPMDIVLRLRTVHAKTLAVEKQVCAVSLRRDIRTSPPSLREKDPEYRFGPPTQPNDLPAKTLPRYSGR